VIIDRKRENVLSITATSQEVAALVAGARMARDVMRANPGHSTPEALAVLERVLGDFDRQAERLREPPGGG